MVFEKKKKTEVKMRRNWRRVENSCLCGQDLVWGGPWCGKGWKAVHSKLVQVQVQGYFILDFASLIFLSLPQLRLH